jgi:plastocyanin
MRKFLLIIYCVALSLLTVSHLKAANADTIYVGTSNGTTVSNSYFPASISVNPGDTVLFIWFSGFHTQQADNGGWSTPVTNFTLSGAGQKQQIKMTSTPGTYTYHCTVHGAGMSGTIVVNTVSGTTSTTSQKYGLEAFPNPFSDEVTLTVNEGNKNLKSIKVFDLIGTQVAEIDLTSKSGISTYRLDFSNLKPGVYFCNVYSDTGIVETKKLFRTK